MRIVTAAEASRASSDLLDVVEAGETVAVTRGGRAIAEIRPVHARTGADLESALSGIPAPDEGFVRSIAAAVGSLSPGADPRVAD